MKTLWVLAVLALGSAMIFGAQIGRPVLVCDVPFAFFAGEKELPAGTYTVADLDSTTGVISIRSSDWREGAALLSFGSDRGGSLDEAGLIFNKYGKDQPRYFLSQVWRPGESVGRAFVFGKREEVTSRLLTSENKPTTVVIVARVMRTTR
jgi:hypothetical protein